MRAGETQLLLSPPKATEWAGRGQRLVLSSVCFHSSQMHLPEGGGRQLGSPGSLRGVGSRASEYRAGGGVLKGWEVHHGRPSHWALLMSFHRIIRSHLRSVYSVKSSLHFKWEFDKTGNLSADEVNGC